MTNESLERRITAMLQQRANDIPADLATPSSADLGTQRLVRHEGVHRPPSNRRRILVSVAAALAVIGGVAIALRAADDPPTQVIGIAPSTTAATTITTVLAEPPPSSLAAAPTTTIPSFDNVAPAPSLAPGEACPTTPITTLSPSKMVRVGQGQAAFVPYFWNIGDITLPARLDRASGLGEIAVFWFAAPDVGSILVRGYQLDGTDVMRFHNGPTVVPSMWVLFSQGFSPFGMPQGWFHEPDTWLYVNNSGCYAIDILGARGYRDRLILKVARE